MTTLSIFSISSGVCASDLSLLVDTVFGASVSASDGSSGPSDASGSPGSSRPARLSVGLSVEQRALRRIQSGLRYSGLGEDRPATQEAMASLLELAEKGQLSPLGVQCVVQQAVEASEQLAGNPTPLSSKLQDAKTLCELAVKAIETCATWDWWGQSWRATATGTRMLAAKERVFAEDERQSFEASNVSTWFNRLCWPERSLFRDAVLKSTLLEPEKTRADRFTKLFDSMFDAPLSTGAAGALQAGLPPFRVFQRGLELLEIKADGPRVLSEGTPALVQILKGFNKVQESRSDLREWVQLLVEAPSIAWLQHDHSRDEERFHASLSSGQECGEDAVLIHPLWVLGVGSSRPLWRGKWSGNAEGKPRLCEVIRSIESMGYGACGERPKAWSGVGAERRKELILTVWDEAANGWVQPSPEVPSALWTFINLELLQEEQGVEVVRTLLSLGAAVTSKSLVGVKPPLSLLAQVNKLMNLSTSSTVCQNAEKVFHLLVKEGLNPIDVLPAPSVKDVYPSLRPIVEASLEREKLRQSLLEYSEEDLREAMALLKEKRARQALLEASGLTMRRAGESGATDVSDASAAPLTEVKKAPQDLQESRPAPTVGGRRSVRL